MRHLFSTLFILFFLVPANAQLPVDRYTQTVKTLHPDSLFSYWTYLKTLDLELLSVTDPFQYDSLSLANMLQTALMIGHHGNKGFNQYANVVPIVNFSHNCSAKAAIAFWPFIRQVEGYGGAIMHFGGEFPTYELESVALNFYNYSLLGQDSLYAHLAIRMDQVVPLDPVGRLQAIYREMEASRKDTISDTIGIWQQQPFKGMKADETFSIVRSAAGNYFMSWGNNGLFLNKLIRTANDTGVIFSPEDEPFGWYFENASSTLVLKNEHGEILIDYGNSFVNCSAK